METKTNTIKTLWESSAKNENNLPFLSVKTWNDRYVFSERLGKDSVAFILIDKNTNQIGVIKEFKPPIDNYLVTAFGGSIDINLPYNEIVQKEAHEEAGYIVELSNILPMGKVMVSTQSNQFCHLYAVIVDKTLVGERCPENDMEADAEVVWINKSQVFNLKDWKAPLIYTKYENFKNILQWENS